MSLFNSAASSYSHYTPRLKLRNFDRAERNRIVLGAKTAGFDSGSCWQFKDGDKKAQEKAKAACQQYADEWEKKLGVGIEVCLGFSL